MSLLTAAEAGERLGISARSVYAIAKAGKIACHRLGLENGAVRFDPTDIEAYKQSCRSPAIDRCQKSPTRSIKEGGLKWPFLEW